METRMPALSESIAALPPLQRRMAEAWLTRFEENWHLQKLRECMRALPAQSTLRRPLLLAMIERDIAHQWEHGQQVGVETYLREFPELGGSQEFPIELVAAEYQVRQRHGGADLSEYADRFPSRVDDLYVLLKPGVFEESNPEVPKAGNVTATRRKELLRKPAEPQTADSISVRRLQLLRQVGIEESPSNGTPLPEPMLPPDVVSAPAAADPEILLPPEAKPPESTKKLEVSPAQTAWLDVDTLREKRSASGLGLARRQTATPPPVLGRYRIDRRLGTSSLGSLYEALDTALDRRVALKVPLFGGPDAEAERARFHREARAAAGLMHPLLCPVLDVGHTESFDFLAMPFVEGDALQELLKQRPVWPPRQAVDLILKLATALDAAHRRGVVHRDLKPSNILIAPSETPVIVGFGQSTRPDHSQQTANSVYVAPEQAAGSKTLVGPRADIYSLGAIFYQVLTGQVPPAPGTPLDLPADLSPELQTICRRAMAAEPGIRYTTMRDFAQELAAFRQSLRSSEPGTRPSSSRNSNLPSSSSRPPGSRQGPSSSTNPAFAQMQELRKLSNSPIPATAPPRPGTMRRPMLWKKYAVVGGVSLLVLVTSVVVLNNQKSPVEPDPWPNARQLETKKEPEVAPPTETVEELIHVLKTGAPAERESATEKLKAVPDAGSTAAALERFIAEGEWSERAARDAAMRALLKIDSLQVPHALKAAAKSDDPRVRAWTYREIAAGKRIDTDNQPVLLPVLLAGLKDSIPDNRRLAAEQIHDLPAKVGQDPAVVAALYSRVCDDVWGEVNNSPANSFVHNPRADGGKNVALELLEDKAPERVNSALNVAARSSNPDVRKWATTKKRDRDK
jgi:serine/threonine protein kinase